MTKPATLHQADIARAIRAAKDAGLKMVEIAMPGGTVIRLPLTADTEIPPLSTQSKPARRKEIVL